MTTTIVGLPVAYIVDSTGKFVDLQLANGDPARLATFVGGVLVAGGAAVPGGGGSTPLVNDLISGGTTSALTAQQGVVLKGLVDTNTTAIGTKQATLLSGTNLRTLNGQSLLGSTDLAIAGGVPNQTGALATSATAAPVADTVIAALATKSTAGVVAVYSTQVTATGSLTVTHFGGTLVPVNSASAVQLNVPLDSALALSALPAGSFHLAAFDVIGAGAVTFAGAAGVTINGIAGPTPVALSFAQFQQALLKQTAANTWTVS